MYFTFLLPFPGILVAKSASRRTRLRRSHFLLSPSSSKLDHAGCFKGTESVTHPIRMSQQFQWPFLNMHLTRTLLKRGWLWSDHLVTTSCGRISCQSIKEGFSTPCSGFPGAVSTWVLIAKLLALSPIVEINSEIPYFSAQGRHHQSITAWLSLCIFSSKALQAGAIYQWMGPGTRD